MKTKKMLIMGLAVCLSIAFVSQAMATECGFSCYLSRYDWVPGTVLDTCGTCHTDFSGETITPENLQLNAYGLDVQQATQALAASCVHYGMLAVSQMDSDGDGTKNIYEISALSFPGYTSLNCPPEANGACDPVPNPGDMDYDGVPSADDCDDYDRTTPGIERCDGADNDCNGLVDDPFDHDGDGYAPCSYPIDCDDHDDTVYPGAPELCDGVDNNCDSVVDEGCITCTDNDGDGYATEGGDCGPVDCDDANSKVNPGASESGKRKCKDGIDNDCDGLVDADDPDCGGDGGGGGEKNCKDGKDNDGDGLIDCADSDCTASRWCS